MQKTNKRRKGKMRKRMMIFGILMVMVWVVGCAGKRHSTFKTNEDGTLEHKGWNISILNPDAGPVLLAEAYRIKKQGDALEAMTKSITEGKTGSAIKGYLIGMINNDPYRSTYFYHPEMPGMKITLDPKGGYFVLPVRTIPTQITLYNANGTMGDKIYPLNDFTGYNYRGNSRGCKKYVGAYEVDLRYTIDKIRYKN